MSERLQLLYQTKGRRGIQEDCILTDSAKGIWVLSDGFGGGEAGPSAARLCGESVLEFLEKEGGDWDATLPFVIRSSFSLAGNVLFNALIYANRRLLGANDKKPHNKKGGAGVLSCFLDGDLLALAQVGGNRGWLIREGVALSLVSPRSYGSLCDPLNQGPEALHQVPLQALGLGADVEPEIFEYRLKPGDWVCLASDGFHRSQKEMIAHLCAAQAEGKDLRSIDLEGFSAGVSDNASVVAFQYA